MKNHSGFYGYSAASIYPDMGSGVTQTLATVPDPDEQQSLSAQEPNHMISHPVDGKKRTGIWLTVAALVVLVFIFGFPKIGG